MTEIQSSALMNKETQTTFHEAQPTQKEKLQALPVLLLSKQNTEPNDMHQQRPIK